MKTTNMKNADTATETTNINKQTRSIMKYNGQDLSDLYRYYCGEISTNKFEETNAFIPFTELNAVIRLCMKYDPLLFTNRDEYYPDFKQAFNVSKGLFYTMVTTEEIKRLKAAMDFAICVINDFRRTERKIKVVEKVSIEVLYEFFRNQLLGAIERNPEDYLLIGNAVGINYYKVKKDLDDWRSGNERINTNSYYVTCFDTESALYEARESDY